MLVNIEEENTMIAYHILYSPVFHSRSKKLAGYNVEVTLAPDLEKFKDYQMFTVSHDDSGKTLEEFDRFKKMLSGVYDPFDDVAFVDKHPMNILRYLRGEKEMPKRTRDWEKDIDRWSVNLRGERVE